MNTEVLVWARRTKDLPARLGGAQMTSQGRGDFKPEGPGKARAQKPLYAWV